jgi:hypothetical protein
MIYINYWYFLGVTRHEAPEHQKNASQGLAGPNPHGFSGLRWRRAWQAAVVLDGVRGPPGSAPQRQRVRRKAGLVIVLCAWMAAVGTHAR